jgi:predicted O-methyltransferase YrrM
MALACLETGGIVTGIDPWSVSEAAQPEIPFRTDNIDYNKLYSSLIVLLVKEELTNVNLAKETSQAMVGTFASDSIDFLHIDGNHSREKALQDVTNYLPKVKPGGIIVLDDVSMPTVKEALDYATARCALIRVDKDNGRDDATFRKPA